MASHGEERRQQRRRAASSHAWQRRLLVRLAYWYARQRLLRLAVLVTGTLTVFYVRSPVPVLGQRTGDAVCVKEIFSTNDTLCNGNLGGSCQYQYVSDEFSSANAACGHQSTFQATVNCPGGASSGGSEWYPQGQGDSTCQNCYGEACTGALDCVTGLSCYGNVCCNGTAGNSCGICGAYNCDGTTCNDPCAGGGGEGDCYPVDNGEYESGGDCECDGNNDCSSDFCNDDGSCGSDDPIVVDLTGAGFALTNAQTGVKFDFFSTAKPIQMPWTAAGSSTGWLALDRNGNGLIDNGTDLFSNVAPQPGSPTRSKLGFRALAFYDLPASGGNGDGVIDRRDAVFSKLLIWVDKNHDGISEPGELLTMQQAGIQSISLHYARSSWTDAYGNQFRYRSQITFAGGGPAGDRYVYDVMLGQGSARTQFK